MVASASWPPVQELFLASFSFVTFALLGAVVGLLWSAFVSAVVLPIVHLFVWSLKPRGNIIWFGAFCGGLIGFVAVLPFVLALASEFARPAASYELVVALSIGPGLTTVLGQLGGAWGGRRGLRYARWYERALAHASLSPSQADGDCVYPADLPVTSSPSPARLQFGVRHLLWMAVWVSLLLSVIRLSGIALEFALPLLVGWFLFQAATLWVGGMVVPRVDAWWASRRKSRST
jgi:hypothetical protein